MRSCLAILLLKLEPSAIAIIQEPTTMTNSKNAKPSLNLSLIGQAVCILEDIIYLNKLVAAKGDRGVITELTRKSASPVIRLDGQSEDDDSIIILWEKVAIDGIPCTLRHGFLKGL